MAKGFSVGGVRERGRMRVEGKWNIAGLEGLLRKRDGYKDGREMVMVRMKANIAVMIFPFASVLPLPRF